MFMLNLIAQSFDSAKSWASLKRCWTLSTQLIWHISAACRIKPWLFLGKIWYFLPLSHSWILSILKLSHRRELKIHCNWPGCHFQYRWCKITLQKYDLLSQLDRRCQWILNKCLQVSWAAGYIFLWLQQIKSFSPVTAFSMDYPRPGHLETN